MSKPQKLRILVVDDEKTVRRFLKATLSAQGYAVFEAVNGTEALETSVSTHPDAILLDLGLPDIDGIDIARQIRNRSRTPIIVLSVREEKSEKVLALDAGADDYLTKPFDAGEMLARLRAVMRRLLPVHGDIYEIKDLRMDVARHTVEVAGNPVKLTPTEYEVLKVLVANAGKVSTHDMILKQVWDKKGDQPGAFHLVRVTVNNLRDKLEPRPDHPSLILTEPGIGYRFFSED